MTDRSLEYPCKPIRLITGAPGGGVDFATRLIAQGLTRSLGQPVTVENLPAGAMAEVVSKAAPDGYTLHMTGMILWLSPFLRANVNYDPVRDFAPISLTVSSPNILVVNPLLPVQSLQELMALARNRPGELAFTSSGSGSSTHLAGELFKVMAGVDIRYQPYAGNVAAIDGVIAGDVQLMFSAVTAAKPHIESGKLRALAVTSKQPSALFPGLPTVAAAGLPGFESASILGLFAPAGTPVAVVSRLNRETVRFLATAQAREQLLGAGLEAVGSSAQELAVTMKSEMTRMGKVIKDAGIRAE